MYEMQAIDILEAIIAVSMLLGLGLLLLLVIASAIGGDEWVRARDARHTRIDYDKSIFSNEKEMAKFLNDVWHISALYAKCVWIGLGYTGLFLSWACVRFVRVSYIMLFGFWAILTENKDA